MTKEQLGILIISSEETLYRVAKTLLADDVDCADAIQETIVKAFTSIATLRKDAYAKTWLIRILINECYSTMRRGKKIVPFDEMLEQTLAAKEPRDYSDLYEALASLPEEMRLTVTLYYIEGYSVRETAELLNTTESAVKNRLVRARKRMKKFLEDGEAVI